MEKEKLIRKMIRDSGQRALREIGACAFVILFFGTRLLRLPIGGVHFAGCSILVLAAVFIAGVVWKFMLGEKLLHQHPAHDVAFWQSIFLSQARLLRLVPYWYLAPLAAGIILSAVPASTGNLTGFYGYLVVVALSFAGLAWINRIAAGKIEEQARLIGS